RAEDQPRHRGAGWGRRRSAQRDLDEHQAADGNRQLSRAPSPAESAGARTAHKDQRAYAQGTAQGSGRKEKDSVVSSFQFPASSRSAGNENWRLATGHWQLELRIWQRTNPSTRQPHQKVETRKR